jgi:hypothetical protein
MSSDLVVLKIGNSIDVETDPTKNTTYNYTYCNGPNGLALYVDSEMCKYSDKGGSGGTGPMGGTCATDTAITTGATGSSTFANSGQFSITCKSKPGEPTGSNQDCTMCAKAFSTPPSLTGCTRSTDGMSYTCDIGALSGNEKDTFNTFSWTDKKDVNGKTEYTNKFQNANDPSPNKVTFILKAPIAG